MEQFPVLILSGRPASGKSEIIDYLLRGSPEEVGSQRLEVREPRQDCRGFHVVFALVRKLAPEAIRTLARFSISIGSRGGPGSWHPFPAHPQ